MMDVPDLQALRGKTVVLGVCGGIAVYKAVEVMRLLIHAGAEVFAVMTESAQRFVTPLTFETLSKHPVYTDMFELLPDGGIGHIALAERADLVLVAPATANMIGKAAGGIADDPLSTLLVATKAPVLWAPAMNVNMWENPLVQENLRKLERHGACVLEPDTGMLACGREGKGKFPAPEKVVAKAAELLGESALLRGETVLVSAGPTWERIDPVRFVGNFSSGKMGYALARQAVKLGAKVLLVSGPVALEAPEGVRRVMVESAFEMRQAVLDWIDEASIVIMAAAVADYRPARVAPQKIKKEGSEALVLELERTADILGEVGTRKGSRFVVGFAAESENLLENARRKLREKHLDLIVANDITQPGAGFGSATNIVTLLDRDGTVEELPCLDKEEVACRILERVSAMRGTRELC